ncbi:hypothetical protein IT087_01545 [Candidatus Uhrbacteria bacterium]|nr:hypothetical protein [Candidatus Uhrbacteria bacterium]
MKRKRRFSDVAIRAKGQSPRKRYLSRSLRYLVALDPAILEVARKVAAGVDRKYEEYPDYEVMVEIYGAEAAQRIVRYGADTIGQCDDLIQNQDQATCVDLYGGLSEDLETFIFYEWVNRPPQLYFSLTPQEARDIVAGKKKYVQFKVCTRRHLNARSRAKKRLKARTAVRPAP